MSVGSLSGTRPRVRPVSENAVPEDGGAPSSTTTGWDAIDAALAALYGEIEPARHWGTLIRWRLGGSDPLDGVSAYARADGSHWHYVSYGLSELYEKESDDPAVSGWGVELTFRLARPPQEQEPPIWPAVMMQNLARYVFRTGRVFRDGHWADVQGPITDATPTTCEGFVFVTDPELGTVRTPNGSVEFVQVVGITRPEVSRAAAGGAEEIRNELLARSPLLVTELAR